MFSGPFVAGFLADLRGLFTLRRQTTLITTRWKTARIEFNGMRGFSSVGKPTRGYARLQRSWTERPYIVEVDRHCDHSSADGMRASTSRASTAGPTGNPATPCLFPRSTTNLFLVACPPFSSTSVPFSSPQRALFLVTSTRKSLTKLRKSTAKTRKTGFKTKT